MKIATGLELKKEPKTPSDFYQYLATFTGTIVIVCTGMHFGWPSPSLPQLLHEDSHIPMTNADGSWVAVMPCMGAVVGCFMAVATVDRIGRKISMLITSPLYCIAWIMVAFSNSVAILHCARFLAGIADGIAFTALPIYLGEISRSEIRGLLGSFIPVTTIMGFLLINIVGSCFDITYTALISASVPIIHFCTFVFMPESPYFLLIRNKAESARKSLITFRGTDDVEVELTRLADAVREEQEFSGSLLDLFTVKSNRRACFIIIGIRAVQQFSGTTAITFYANTIFKEAGSNMSSSTAAIIYFSIQLTVATLASVLVDKLGRRPLLIFSIIGSGFALATEGIYIYLKNNSDVEVDHLHWVPVFALLMYVVIFNLGMGTIPVLLLGELFPTNVKAFALCLADIYFGVIVTIVSKFFQIMKDDFGMHVPFLVFTSFCAIGLVFITFYVPETKGKTLEEIQMILRGEETKNEKDCTKI